ncbi:hypothetical protein MSSAC_3694 [Methanosarcina siciliae C2J]|uniref:Uncharacterized protein n=4 Tax=Methanosarcina siciliae TaxID=38027 RepID=A0A0E3PGP3_9EURY|nr:hypothetical protein [Methanosarcina siciliae]AKB30020.1 hypothetical protein MSSIT_3301 [Methanosarcina siciliae T4/M]AKB33920.1 hypothetical protein MSSIH_3230 [Methanosarcina siciliae HI350]AKB38284.1 hypothetical protein MSSAC_3694 [Methanosarcina siciliae C2J]
MMKNNLKNLIIIIKHRFEISSLGMALNKKEQCSRGGIMMFFYLNYLKITFYLEIERLRIIYLSGYGILNG